MCTVWAALFLFLPLSVSVPLFHPPRLHRSPSSPNPRSPIHPSPRFVCLSRSSSSLNRASRLPSLPRRVRLVFLDSSRLRLPSLALPLPPPPGPSPRDALVPFLLLSLRLSRGLDFSPASFTPPLPIFPLPRVYHPSPVRHHLLQPPLFQPSSQPSRSIFPPRAALYIPRCLRRDGPIFSSRFLGSNIFYTFFLPSPAAAHAPLPRHREYRLEHPLRLPLAHVSHTHMISFPLAVRLSSALFLLPHSSTSRPRPFPPAFHFSLPPRTTLAPIFLIFFFHDYPTTYRRRASASFFYRDALLDHRLGHVLTYTRIDSHTLHTRSRAHIHTVVCASRRAREGETVR